jgi:hypothetical protein
MPKIEKVPVSGFSPYYGCVILILAACIFGGIISWSAYALLKQDEAIQAFAAEAPAVLPEIAATAEELASLKAKLKAFADSSQAGQAAEMQLELRELNQLILLAAQTGHGDYKEMLRFTGLDPARQGVIAQASFPLNSLPFIGKGKRYLNGEVCYQLLLNEAGLDAKVIQVKVPGKSVAEGFIQGMGTWTLLSSYRSGDAGIASALKAIQKVTVEGQRVVLANKK